MAIIILLLLFSTPLAAVDIDQLSWTETKDKWGQLLFCQRIYNMPEVQSRLYSFDVEQCDKAGQLMADIVSKYSQQQQLQLKNQAEKHAYAVAQNTTEPYQSVTACRAYCSELSKIQDQRNER